MKRLVTVLLISAILLSVTSCGYISDKLNKFYTFAENTEITFYTEQEENSQNTDVYEKEKCESESSVADFSSYEAIIETYKSIVSCFTEYTYDQYKNNEYIYTLEIPNDETRVIYDKIFSSAYYNYLKDYASNYNQDGRNYFGYAIFDINENGSEELILLNDHYDIIAIFTNYNGYPELIVENDPFCRIKEDGEIYTYKRVKESDYSYYYDVRVCSLSECDELVVTHEFTTKTPLYKNHVGAITLSSVDLDFIRLFEDINPQLPSVYGWTWYESELNSNKLLLIGRITETEVRLSLCLDTSPWTHIADVTAIRSGESAYFECDVLKGRIEFGHNCIWVVIEESNDDRFSHGAYMFEDYLSQK